MKAEEDKIIEVNGKEYSMRKILGSGESWNLYTKGRKVFKEAVETGIKLQLMQINQLLTPKT